VKKRTPSWAEASRRLARRVLDLSIAILAVALVVAALVAGLSSQDADPALAAPDATGSPTNTRTATSTPTSTPTPPPAPLLLGPALGETTTAEAYPPVGVPTFQWEVVPGAVEYELQVNTDSAFGGTWVVGTSLAGQKTVSTQFTPLTNTGFAGSTYYWRVRAYGCANATCTIKTPAGPWSETWQFTQQPGLEVVLCSPIDTTTLPLVPTFRWAGKLPPGSAANPCDDDVAGQGAIGASKYWLQIDTDSGFGTIALKNYYTSGTSFTPTSALPRGTYYWRVMAVDPYAHAGPPAGPYSFVSDWSQGELRPQLLTPQHTVTNVAFPLFSWTPVEGAAKYKLVVSKGDSSFLNPNAISLDVMTVNTSYSVSVDKIWEPMRPDGHFVAGETYYWAVSALGVDGAMIGAQSAPNRFTTSLTETPVVPSLLYPPHYYSPKVCEQDNQTATECQQDATRPGALPPTAYNDVTARVPVFRWDGVPGDHSYRLQVADNPGFSPTVVDQVTDNTTYSPTSSRLANGDLRFDPFRDYYWRVCATDYLDCSGPSPALSWSQTWITRVNGAWQDAWLAAENATVVGKYAYVAAGAKGIVIIDVSDLAVPMVVGRVDTPGFANAVYVVGKLAYVADGPSGVEIVDVSNPYQPVILNALDTPAGARSLVVSGRYAYVAAGSAGLYILDAGTPDAPVLSVASYLDTIGTAEDVALLGVTAVVADGASGIRFLDISNPLVPTQVGVYPLPLGADGIWGVAVIGTNVHAAAGTGGLRSLNAVDPAHPVEVGTILSLTNARRVVRDPNAKRLYIADVNSVDIVDADDPANPAVVGTANTGSPVPGLAYSDGVVQVAQGPWGVRPISVAVPSASVVGRLQTTPEPLHPTYKLESDGKVYGEERVEFAPSLEWSPVAPQLDGSTVSYQVQASLDRYFATAAIDAVTDFTAYTHITELPNGTYFWRVRASEHAVGASPTTWTTWSRTSHFVLSKRPTFINPVGSPACPTYGQPGCGSIAIDGTINFDASHVLSLDGGTVWAASGKDDWYLGFDALPDPTTAATYALLIDTDHADSVDNCTLPAALGGSVDSPNCPEFVLSIQVDSTTLSTVTPPGIWYEWNGTTWVPSPLTSLPWALSGIRYSHAHRFVELGIPQSVATVPNDVGAPSLSVRVARIPTAPAGTTVWTPGLVGTAPHEASSFAAQSRSVSPVLTPNRSFDSVSSTACQTVGASGVGCFPLGTESIATMPRFSWLTTDDAYVHRFQAAKDRRFATIVNYGIDEDGWAPDDGPPAMHSFGTNSSYAPTVAWADYTDYRWRLFYVDPYRPAPAAFGQIYTFRLKTPAPAGLATSPMFGGFTRLLPTLRWQPVEGAIGYQVWLDFEGGDYAPTVLKVDNTQTTSWTPFATSSTVPFLQDGSYQWKVRAITASSPSGTNYGTWSDAAVFLKQYPLVKQLAPLNGSWQPAAPTFAWECVPGASRYSLQWSSSPVFTSLTSVVTDNCSYTPTMLWSGGTYYWRVAMVDGANNKGPYQDAKVLVGQWYGVYLPGLLRP
jgi:hypothetical protein